MDIQTGSMQWTRGELLGEGSFGRVYAGLNQQTGELMAVKELELVTRHKAGLQSTVMQQLQELQQELELYKNLQHMHVVTYIDHHFDKRRSTLYIFLEYVPGGSIASMLDRYVAQLAIYMRPKPSSEDCSTQQGALGRCKAPWAVLKARAFICDCATWLLCISAGQLCVGE